jgi:hypothetical protein
MDWKYKHFHQERSFPATGDDVADAARTYVSNSLGWPITGTADGFTAQGSSFMHAAIAHFKIETADTGATNLSIELLVQRAGSAGFMLFDVGGYYGIQLRKWFDGIQSLLHEERAAGQSQGPLASPIPAPPPANKTKACLFNGCLGFIAVMFGLWALVTLICAIVGLITGTLLLWGRGGTIVVHGIWARIISALILFVAAWIGWKLKTSRRRKVRRD